MTNTSIINLLKAYKLAITKEETAIANLLEKVVISEINRNDYFDVNPLNSPPTLPSILTGPTYTDSNIKLTDDVLHTT